MRKSPTLKASTYVRTLLSKTQADDFLQSQTLLNGKYAYFSICSLAIVKTMRASEYVWLAGKKRWRIPPYSIAACLVGSCIRIRTARPRSFLPSFILCLKIASKIMRRLAG